MSRPLCMVLLLAGMATRVEVGKTDSAPLTYEPSAELGNNLLCYSTEGFTFYRIDQGIKLVTANAE